MKLADSSCLICVFHEMETPFILMGWKNRGYTIAITPEVMTELQENNTSLKKITPDIKNGDIKITDQVNSKTLEQLRVRHPNLGKGELSIIATSMKLKHQGKRYYAVLDDRNARKAAEMHGVKYTGTYGLLKTLLDKGEITEDQFNQWKQIMQKSDFRINFDKIE